MNGYKIFSKFYFIFIFLFSVIDHLKNLPETQLNQQGPQVSTGASGGHLGAVGPFELMTQRTHINAMVVYYNSGKKILKILQSQSDHSSAIFSNFFKN